MAKLETHYDILRVAPHASVSVIKVAYKSLCQTYHPDKFRGDVTEGSKIFKSIQQSYAVLSDPIKKAEYDAWLAQSLKHSGKASKDASAVIATPPVFSVSRRQQSNKVLVPNNNRKSKFTLKPQLRRFLTLFYVRRVMVLLVLILGVLAIQSQILSGRWQQLNGIAPHWNLLKDRVVQLVKWEESDKFSRATASHRTVAKPPHRALNDKPKIKTIAYKKEAQAKSESRNINSERAATISNQNSAIADKLADDYSANQPECDIAVILMDEHVVRCK